MRRQATTVNIACSYALIFKMYLTTKGSIVTRVPKIVKKDEEVKI